MKKAKVGDKFIIEIADVIDGGETGCPQYRIKGFDKVFFDDKGLGILEEYFDNDFNAACRIGAEAVWKMAHEIMEIPIDERAEMFGISHNQACFKDISAKFDVYDAAEKFYNNVGKQKEINRRDEIQNKLAEFAEENGFSMSEIKVASKMILRKGK